jgi:hypothetical protein
MSEPYLTMAEIEAKYPNQWVLLDKPTLGRSEKITGGHVVAHCADRAEFVRRFEEIVDSLSDRIASWYTGSFPPEEVLPPEAESGAA